MESLASETSLNLLSGESVSKLNMALSSIASAITSLIEKDVLEKKADGSYLIINPIIKYVLQDSIIFYG